MNRKTLAFMAAIVFSFCGVTFASQEGVRWEGGSIQAAQRLAVQTRRLVLVHFWSPTCNPCQKMDRLVFSRPDVAAAVETYYVPVKINADQFPYTARQYGITALPTDLVLSPNGQVIRRFQGAVPAEQYIAQLQQVAAEMQLAAPSGLPGSDPAVWAQGMQPPPPNHVPISPSLARSYEGADRGNVPPASPPQTPPTWTRTSAGFPPFSGSEYPAQTAAAMPNASFPSSPGPYSQPTPGPGPDVARSAPLAERSMNPPLLNGDSSSLSRANPTGLPSNSGFTNALPNSGFPNTSPNSSLNPSSTIGLSQNAQFGGRNPSPGTEPAIREGYAPSPGADVASRGGIWPSAGGMGPSAGGMGPSTESVDSWPPGLPPLAMEGYCPVELVEKRRWVLGTHPWGVIHRGRTYMCAGPEEQKKFLADPDRYAPVMSGQDIVLAMERGQSVPGRREYGVFYRGRVYLFADETTLDAFRKNPRRYIEMLSAGTAPETETASRR